MTNKNPRVSIITGSSRGIGLEIAKKFLENGDKVVVFCRHKDGINEVKDELLKHGDESNILMTYGDVRKIEDVKRIVKETIDKFGRIDVLVNNAGVAIYKPIEETTEEDWDKVLNTNLKGSFLFTKVVVPLMKEQESGIIINISSGLGEQGAANYSAYSPSKFGLIGLTESVADEVIDSGVKVYAVLPGGVNTKLHRDMHPDEDTDTMMSPEHIAENIFEVAEGKRKTGESIRAYN